MSVQSLVEENWQTTKPTIKERCTFLFNNDVLSDVKLIVPAVTSAESESKKAKRVIPAHKFILSISSPVFYTMFNGELPETGNSVEVLDCEYETLLEFVRFLYSDEVNLSGSNVLQVLYLAKKYMVPSLADKCRKFLEDNLFPSTVFSVLPFAELYEDKALLYHCWKLIDRQTKVVLESAESIERSVLEALVERDTLHIKEIDLFTAVSRWATNECGKQGLEAGGKVKRRVLGDRVIKAIRFPLMTESEFTSVVVNSEILSAEEVSDLKEYFKTGSSHPVGFSKKARTFSSRGDLLRCNRFTGGGYAYRTWPYYGSPDSLLFEVSRDIVLHGVRLFGKDDNNYSVALEVINDTDKSSLLSETGKFTTEPVHDYKVGDYEGFEFLFDTPVDIKKNTKYRVRALISGPPSMRGAGRYRRTGCSGVQFSFFSDEGERNGTNDKFGQFPEFLFTKHQKKILDETLPIRYSGLSNNAHLELVASQKSKKAQSNSTVGLQLESGERLVKEFSSSASLWDVLTHWDSDQESPHQGKIINPSPEEQKSPVCIYMTQEIKGEISLRSATLHSLGLTGKRAVIRLMHRQLQDVVEEPKIEEIPSSEEAKSDPGQTVISSRDLMPSAENEIISGQRNIPINEPVVTSATSSSKTTSQESSSEFQRNVRVDNIAKMSFKDTHIPETAKEPKRARINPPKPPFANFKCAMKLVKEKVKFSSLANMFPEETAGMDLFQREKADSSRKEFLATSCDRQPVVFSEEDPSSPKPDEGEIPDSFFEVTVDDIRVMLRDLKNERKQADSAPLMTRAMREVREESEMYKYDKVVVRIKFPDRLVLQAFFRPMEKVSALTEFVRSLLEDQNVKFYLYTTPPRRILDKSNATLFENKLYPASVIHFGCHDQQKHFLAGRLTEKLSTFLDAEKAVIDIGVLSVRSSSRPDIGDSLVSSSTVDDNEQPGSSLGGAGIPDRPREGLNSSSSNIPRTGGASKGAVPKWFKGTGK